MDDITRGLFSNFISSKSDTLDLGNYLKGEIEESISPVTSRVDRLEKKLDLLLLAVERVEKLLTTLTPVIKIINKLPFLK